MRGTEEYRESVRVALRKRKVMLRAKGICVGCGKKPVRETTEQSHRKPSLCGDCAKHHCRRARERRQAFRERGVCTRCGKRPSRADVDQCEICAPVKAKTEEVKPCGRPPKVKLPTQAHLNTMMVERMMQLASRRRA